jgi:hypothetical protein
MEREAIRWVKVNKIDTQVKIQQDILNEAKYRAWASLSTLRVQ